MLKACEQAVEKLCIKLCKAAGLYTQSTVRAKYLTSQVFFMRSLYTVFEQSLCAYEQPSLDKSDLLCRFLSTFYTLPMNTTNLIKE